MIHYDDKNDRDIGVTAVTANTEMLKSLFVDRPCGDLRLWEALISLLRMGSIDIFWPRGLLAVFDDRLDSKLPKDITDAIGPAKSVGSAEDLHQLF